MQLIRNLEQEPNQKNFKRSDTTEEWVQETGLGELPRGGAPGRFKHSQSFTVSDNKDKITATPINMLIFFFLNFEVHPESVGCSRGRWKEAAPSDNRGAWLGGGQFN